ncbi:hypothetical protein [Azospira restricta]|uniref:Agglutinin biogenesis protein MshI n=1 Tax=Azospira restricta TaxID=404405 RepID=A0A974SRD0_9RHOO|nr:hypothetical protein [Azospira restricta]QRJ65093.1 agglutinin biogenesis protein MshI [Azospira restricta]
MAVALSRDRVDLAHVRRDDGRRPRIAMLESFQRTADTAAALTRLRAAKRLAAYRCTTLLDSGQYQLAQLDAPAVPAEERADALRWRLKDMVDFAVDGASIGVVDVPMEGAGRQPLVYAVAAPESAVAPLMRTFDAAGVPLAVIDIPEFAQRNVAALFEEENRGLAFLHLDENGGLLTITYRGELYALRRVDVSARQLADADSERRTQLLERIMLELQRTLDNFDRQFSFVSVSGLVVASCPLVPDLQPYLAENLYVPVQAMDLARVCDFDAVPELRAPERQAQCLPAIGAALRTPGAV